MAEYEITWTPVAEGLPAPGYWLVTVDTDSGRETHILELDSSEDWIHEGEPTYRHGYYFRVVAWAERPEPAPFHKSEAEDYA